MATEERGRPASEFRIGAPVIGRDGEEGTLRRVVLDPETGHVVDLVVEFPDVTREREVVLPVERVTHSDARGTWTDLDAEGMRALADFEEIHFRRPAEGWPGLPEDTPDAVLFWAPTTAVEAFRPPSIVPEPNVEADRNIPPGSVSVSADLDVICAGAVVGHVREVIADADHATHLVVRRPGSGVERLVPVQAVRRVTDSAVELNCDEGRLDSFPEYRAGA